MESECSPNGAFKVIWRQRPSILHSYLLDSLIERTICAEGLEGLRRRQLISRSPLTLNYHTIGVPCFLFADETNIRLRC